MATKQTNKNGKGSKATTETPPSTILQTATDVVNLPIGMVVADLDFNARKSYDDKEIADLAASIKRNGQQSPVLVTPRTDGRYDLIFGFQRFKAISEVLKAPTIRATVKSEVMSEKDRVVANLVENVQRSNLSSYDLALAIKRIQDKEGLKGGQIGTLLSKSEGYVNNLLRVQANASPTVLDRWRQENEAGADIRKVLTTDVLNRIIKHDHDTQDMMLRKELGEEVSEGGEGDEEGGEGGEEGEALKKATTSMLKAALRAADEAKKSASNAQMAAQAEMAINCLKYALGHKDRIPAIYDHGKAMAEKEKAKAEKEKAKAEKEKEAAKAAKK